MFSINFSSALEVKRWFLALLLIMFNTHYLLVDFGLISITKLTVMALCPFLLLSFHKNISKPLIIALLYLLAIYICALQHPAQFRMTTIIYTALYVFLLVTFTTILYSEENVLTLNFAIKLLNRLIWIYILVVIAQQLFILIGIRHFTPLNLGGDSYLEVNRVPGLSLEPSHSGRIMCVAFYAWLKLNEFQKGVKMTAPLGNVKASVPPEQLKAKMNPGDVSFLGFERKDNVFTVTFAWIDMIGGHHEHTFARGDIFADFNKVLKVFTDGGLPIDPAKADDFHMRLCQLSTVMVQEQAPAAKAEAKKEEAPAK